MVIKMENKTYIVYMHRCPNDKKYIGVTRVKTYSRFHGGSGYRYNKEFYSDIKKYGWGNIEHIIVSENIDKEQAYKLEQELIKKYNTTNFKNGFSALIWNSEDNSLTTFGNFALIFLGVSITFAIVKLCLNLIRSKTGA